MQVKRKISDRNEFYHVAHSSASKKLLSLARRLAKINVPVLITGETGTGKECVAKYIHHHAFSYDAPYIGVNCAAIPENMLEAILFGYEKGAFTGAISSQPGKFELANGGTLLLDEIGDMPIALQAKLLRVLQEKRVERLGSHKSVPLNIRLITATNKDLNVEIAQGRFRQDLFYRLSVVPVPLTPLRERKEDILPLTELFIEKYRTFSNNHPRLTPQARSALLAWDWPGNVRELENAVQRGLIMSENGLLDADCFSLVAPKAEGISAPECIENNPVRQCGKQAEFQYIADLLKYHEGNKSRTAASLGITPRALRYRLASMREQGFTDAMNVSAQKNCRSTESAPL
ncbi:sigma-54 dependent transcriptional regulator [Erwinia tracheiphila]|uniref:Sigma-54-dependent Fis family transcriptional regulator n=1 Tax=Erwinia tracheiphila TaxID=65700 RepID=A0A345CY80_9GAMM|nr:sigma-54 dependent transcriptional regulator [Erwinia tracheiphila]AXF78397.1 sigma-54-dependent Fis family transcriptional regulator [Erwinia tracheiphila]EOS95778.1 Sigma-54 dependent transcriptional regulator [Erwinia tracheiphila PSU-1]UIA88847.1 sigma-54 dependent transcriptional regulator [Erwinia tracheiphila]UIA91460.1 sigma-54 dependent transcriptional regulator [Erwinia tracheiphila]UIA97228.1 sigma-54 dependent transcriptional regulator [Erwinia tracheiphila]